MRALLPGFLSAVLGVLPGLSHANLVYTFDLDAQGWTVEAGGNLRHKLEGGKHGGFLRITDVSSDDFLLIAPPDALGDWSVYANGTLSFMARNRNNDTPDWPPFGEVTISNGALSVRLDLAPDPAPAADRHWHKYSAALTPELWGADLAAVLSNVTRVSIKLEFHAGVTEKVEFDDFKVRRAMP